MLEEYKVHEAGEGRRAFQAEEKPGTRQRLIHSASLSFLGVEGEGLMLGLSSQCDINSSPFHLQNCLYLHDKLRGHRPLLLANQLIKGTEGERGRTLRPRSPGR